MARLLCRNLLRQSPAAGFLGLRRFSGQSGTAQAFVLDIGDEGDASAPAASLMDEVVQSILVRRSTPDWLPFVPGASFWVPPRNSLRVDVSLAGGFDGWLTEEEAPSYPSNHGWPSLPYFVEGKFPQPMMISRNAKTHSDDENN